MTVVSTTAIRRTRCSCHWRNRASRAWWQAVEQKRWAQRSIASASRQSSRSPPRAKGLKACCIFCGAVRHWVPCPGAGQIKPQRPEIFWAVAAPWMLTLDTCSAPGNYYHPGGLEPNDRSARRDCQRDQVFGIELGHSTAPKTCQGILGVAAAYHIVHRFVNPKRKTPGSLPRPGGFLPKLQALARSLAPAVWIEPTTN